MDIRAYNREAWNKQVEKGNQWTVPVSHEQIEDARKGNWELVLTPTKPVPADWYPPFQGEPVLCLASGGGQQAPILAAAGGIVTTLDNSPRQLERDREVAAREGLQIETIEGDMCDLSAFPDNHFALVFHPVSNIFVPEVLPVWRQAFRVLKPGGVLLSGILNPIQYIFDITAMDEENRLEVRYPLPYSDIEHLPRETLEKYRREDIPLEFSHSLEEQIGGQIQAGFHITGFFEDVDPHNLLDRYAPMFIATRAWKPVQV